MPTKNDHKNVTTVETSLEILETLRVNEGARIVDLAEELDLAQSTVHRHLQTLKKNEYIIENENEYHPSLKFLQFSEYTTDHIKGYDLIGKKVAQLADISDEKAQFMVEEHGRAVYIHQSLGENAVLTNIGIGYRNLLHSTAAGKAILAYTSEEKINEIFDQFELKKVSENTITSTDELFEELEQIRERGYSVNNEESIKGHRSIGVPVLDEKKEPFGALSVSGPAHRMQGDWFYNELSDHIQNMANEIELYLCHN